MWFWLALGSAILGAIEIIISKKALKKVSPATLNWAINSLSLIVLIPLVLMEGIPSLNYIFWMAVILSTFTFVVGRNIYNHALKNNLASDIVPLTAFSGIFVYLFGLILLSETIKPIPLLGLLVVLVGAYILNVAQAKEDILRPFKLILRNKASMLFLFAMALTSLTVIFDKMGIINMKPASPLFLTFTEQTLATFMMTIYLIKTETKTWVLEVKNNFIILFICSLFLLAIAFAVFSAYAQEGPAALVIGIKRLQILIALGLGYLFLKDKPTKFTWIASVIMIAGVILIRIG